MKEEKDSAFAPERNTNGYKEGGQQTQLGTEGEHTLVENNVLFTSFIFFSAEGKRFISVLHLI